MSAQKVLQGSKTRELLGGTKESSPIRGQINYLLQKAKQKIVIVGRPLGHLSVGAHGRRGLVAVRTHGCGCIGHGVQVVLVSHGVTRSVPCPELAGVVVGTGAEDVTHWGVSSCGH